MSKAFIPELGLEIGGALASAGAAAIAHRASQTFENLQRIVGSDATPVIDITPEQLQNIQRYRGYRGRPAPAEEVKRADQAIRESERAGTTVISQAQPESQIRSRTRPTRGPPREPDILAPDVPGGEIHVPERPTGRGRPARILPRGAGVPLAGSLGGLGAVGVAGLVHGLLAGAGSETGTGVPAPPVQGGQTGNSGVGGMVRQPQAITSSPSFNRPIRGPQFFIPPNQTPYNFRRFSRNTAADAYDIANGNTSIPTRIS